MKIRITTIRSLPGWDLEKYARDMAKNGVPVHKVEEFHKHGVCSVIMGNPQSETYQTTRYEILANKAPVRAINARIKGKGNQKMGRKEKPGTTETEKSD